MVVIKMMAINFSLCLLDKKRDFKLQQEKCTVGNRKIIPDYESVYALEKSQRSVTGSF